MKTLPGFTGYGGPRIGSEFKWRTTAMQTAQTTATEATPAAELKIKIEPIKGDSPNKLIIVNGRAWARTSAKSLSRYGVRYTFLQLADRGERETICYPRSGSERNLIASQRSVTPEVQSHSKQAFRNNGDERSTEQRLIDMARELIAAGHLIHPTKKQARIDAARAGYEASLRRKEAEEMARFREKAIEALAPAMMLEPELLKAVLANVIEAMEWAQSQ